MKDRVKQKHKEVASGKRREEAPDSPRHLFYPTSKQRVQNNQTRGEKKN